MLLDPLYLPITVVVVDGMEDVVANAIVFVATIAPVMAILKLIVVQRQENNNNNLGLLSLLSQLSPMMSLFRLQITMSFFGSKQPINHHLLPPLPSLVIL
jgi:hypothetical protein